MEVQRDEEEDEDAFLLQKVHGVRFHCDGELSIRKPGLWLLIGSLPHYGRNYDQAKLVATLGAASTSVAHYSNSFVCSEIAVDIPTERLIFGDHRRLTQRGTSSHRCGSLTTGIANLKQTHENGRLGSVEGDQSNQGLANDVPVTVIPLPWLRALRLGTFD